MSKSTLTPHEIQLSRKILRNLKAIKQKDMATELNTNKSTMSYWINTYIPKWLPKFIKVIELGGYELVEKEL